MSQFKKIKLYGKTYKERKANFDYLVYQGYKIHANCLAPESEFLEDEALFGESDGTILHGCFEDYEAEEDAEEVVLCWGMHNDFIEVSELDGHPELSQKDAGIADKPITSDGGSSSYYALTITNKAGQSIDCQMGDIIRCVYGDNFSLGNIAKACRRMYEASQGRGKQDVSIEYDARKISYFANEYSHWHKEK